MARVGPQRHRGGGDKKNYNEGTMTLFFACRDLSKSEKEMLS